MPLRLDWTPSIVSQLARVKINAFCAEWIESNALCGRGFETTLSR
jgi:hypothetical protein